MDNIKLSVDLKIKKHIVLIGMMGCGKSTVGRRIASNLGIKFFDTDSSIEEDQGLLIAQIFADHGEAYFRNLEAQKIRELFQVNPCVISAGGGLVTTPENISLIKDNAVSVWLKSDIKTILKRFDGDDSRPLLQDGDKEKKLVDLLKEREPLYSKADIHIDNNGDIETVVSEIEQQLGNYNETT